jgi:hypothetical protein
MKIFYNRLFLGLLGIGFVLLLTAFVLYHDGALTDRESRMFRNYGIQNRILELERDNAFFIARSSLIESSISNPLLYPSLISSIQTDNYGRERLLLFGERLKTHKESYMISYVSDLSKLLTQINQFYSDITLYPVIEINEFSAEINSFVADILSIQRQLTLNAFALRENKAEEGALTALQESLDISVERITRTLLPQILQWKNLKWISLYPEIPVALSQTEKALKELSDTMLQLKVFSEQPDQIELGVLIDQKLAIPFDHGIKAAELFRASLQRANISSITDFREFLERMNALIKHVSKKTLGLRQEYERQYQSEVQAPKGFIFDLNNQLSIILGASFSLVLVWVFLIIQITDRSVVNALSRRSSNEPHTKGPSTEATFSSSFFKQKQSDLEEFKEINTAYNSLINDMTTLSRRIQRESGSGALKPASALHVSNLINQSILTAMPGLERCDRFYRRYRDEFGKTEDKSIGAD